MRFCVRFTYTLFPTERDLFSNVYAKMRKKNVVGNAVIEFAVTKKHNTLIIYYLQKGITTECSLCQSK